MDLMRADEASEEETEEFRVIHRNKSLAILEKEPHELFDIIEVIISLPPKAKIERSEICNRCGEPTMASKLESVGDKKMCPECASFMDGCD
jgi:formylmethanofuran dehydrogenase subunit E